MDVLATDRRSGRAVGDLAASDLAVSEDGERQTITYFSRDELPLSTILMFDLTDTVRPVLKTLGTTAMDVLSLLKPQDEVAVTTFSSTAQLVEGFTAYRRRIVDAIERASAMKSREATFLNESVYRVAELAKLSRAGNRRAIICLTDGTVNLPSQNMVRRRGASVPDGKPPH